MPSLARWWATLRGDLTGQSEGPVLERNIRLNTLHGMVSVAAANLVGPFVGIFAVKLEASNLQVALLSSAPAVVSLLSMIPGGKFVDRQRHKKAVTAAFLLAHRSFYLLMATIPLFPAPLRPAVLVTAVALMNLPGAIGNVAWQGFISRIVPQQRRATAFAARNRAMNLFGTMVVLLAGRILDMLGYPFGYQLMFSLAFLVALGEIWVFTRLEESEETPPSAQTELAGQRRSILGSIGRDLREIVGYQRFLRYTLASIFFYFAWQTAWPLFTLYQVKVLGANNLWVSILSLMNTGGSLVGYGYWARFMDRHGSLRTLFVSTVGIFIVPTVYAFSHSLVTVAVFNLVTGAIFSGVNLALFNALLEFTPEDKKTTYIAYYSTAVNASAIFAPMAGVALLNLVGFFWAFLAAAALRIMGSLTFFYLGRLERREEARQNSAAAVS
ncbi:MAG: MFS transporter [Bacillota bacterium]